VGAQLIGDGQALDSLLVVEARRGELHSRAAARRPARAALLAML